jgi:hypothetical protein
MTEPSLKDSIDGAIEALQLRVQQGCPYCRQDDGSHQMGCEMAERMRNFFFEKVRPLGGVMRVRDPP